ncbi:hypothetical protein GB937_010576 [Aspergillus fischeri]|nr:hypothetical protein GB937_010576 [Aspergillus fischeri]
MKIVIVGAGISGLATYLFLKRHLPSHEICIYEKRHISRPQGAGVGVSANGLQVLKDLGLLDKLLHAGSECKYFSIHGANGWPLAKLRTGRHAHEFCISISRHALWKVLMKEAGDVASYCEVRGIRRDPSTERVPVQLEQADDVETDLVIGADGIHSIVREHLLGPDKFSPRDSGYAWVVGCMDIAAYPKLQERKDAMHFTIGKDGIFSYSAGDPHSLTWLSIFPKQHPFSSNPKYLLDRHQHWNDPVVQNIISKAEPGRVYDIMTVPKLPTWGEGGNRSGWGFSPCNVAHHWARSFAEFRRCTNPRLTTQYNDSELLCRRTNGSLAADIGRSLSLYYHIRHERVETIAARGEAFDKNMLNAKPLAVYVRYCLLWALNKFPGISK